MSNQTHSPLPWNIKTHKYNGDIIISNAEDETLTMDDANVQFIIRAVNNHDHLISVLSNLVIAIEENIPKEMKRELGHGKWSRLNDAKKALKNATEDKQ